MRCCGRQCAEVRPHRSARSYWEGEQSGADEERVRGVASRVARRATVMPLPDAREGRVTWLVGAGRSGGGVYAFCSAPLGSMPRHRAHESCVFRELGCEIYVDVGFACPLDFDGSYPY